MIAEDTPLFLALSQDQYHVMVRPDPFYVMDDEELVRLAQWSALREFLEGDPAYHSGPLRKAFVSVATVAHAIAFFNFVRWNDYAVTKDFMIGRCLCHKELEGDKRATG